MSNPYVDFCISVQAARRKADKARTPIAAALGVAASVYTHQIANTYRVLTDIRVRHLLADEVGLGKTVQALMIVNALRSQRPDLKVLVIVPDELAPQWRDEIFTRAHSAPVDDEDEAEGSQYIRLAWPALLNSQGETRWSLPDVDALRYDVLVVDELHKLTTQVQNRVVTVAVDFQHVLILTATPAFQDSQRHAQLFALLEPERTGLFSRNEVSKGDKQQSEMTPIESSSNWSESTASKIVNRFLEWDTAVSAAVADETRVMAALAACAYRRVIRTRRIDFSGVLPRRRHIPILVEPLGNEIERQSLMWQYFEYLDELSSRFDAVLLAKRVVLSPPSLEQRVDFFRRKGHERGGLLERVKPLVHRSRGDTRADALVDLLNEVWSLDPNERVLVAAQDSLTVDYLFDLIQLRLPEVGPIGSRIPLIAARIRQGMTTDAIEDLAGVGNETNENLEAFQRGEAKLLIAPEVAQVGLNLQCARILVLYSVPWRPEEVEQWIGRLDRIGNTAAFTAYEAAKTIDVYTIAQRGLIDSNVVMVLQRFRVFERSVNLDGEHLAELAGLIEQAALHPENVNWNELEFNSERMAEQDSGIELNSQLRSWLPWGVDDAKRLKAKVDKLSPFEPVLIDLRDNARAGPKAWDRALEGMIKLFGRAGEYRLFDNRDAIDGSFRTLWYHFGPQGSYGEVTVRSRVVLSLGADPLEEPSSRNAFAFITRRNDIATPPRRYVSIKLDDRATRRTLHFLNFGDPLHDELIERWDLTGADPLRIMDVGFVASHAFFNTCEAGVIILRITQYDPLEALSGVKGPAMQAIADAVIEFPIDRLLQLLAPFKRRLKCALEADARWLSGAIDFLFEISALRKTDTSWAVLSQQSISDLLNPMASGRKELPPSEIKEPTPEQKLAIQAAIEQLRLSNLSRLTEHLKLRIPEFIKALETRLFVVEQEEADEVALRQFELEDADEKLTAAQNMGNRSQITRAENDRAGALAQTRMVKSFWHHRKTWLSECKDRLTHVVPTERAVAVIRVRRLLESIN